MKLNFGLLGIALAQSGDDYSDERHDYSYDYNLGNSHYSGFGGDQSYSFNDFGGKFATGTLHNNAQRLSCWNSNSLRDMNHDGKFADHSEDAGLNAQKYHHYNHQYGFENAYFNDGTSEHPGGFKELADFGDSVDSDRTIDVSDYDHSVMAVDPNKWGYQSNNPDAKYHYGHHVEDPNLASNVNRPHSYQITDNINSFDGVIDDWRYSLRHAGCLYEAPDYFYSGSTFNTLRYLTYSYDKSVSDLAQVPSNTNVHWVHVFNAHIHIDASANYCTSAVHGTTGQSCINTDSIHQFAVVMANPTYEGLGFINFVATYHDAFAPGTQTSSEGHRFRSNYVGSALYENSGFWHLSSTGPDLTTNGGDTWHLSCDSAGCDNIDWNDGNAKGLAISSFPHNQLGKDFRFNIRTLHTMGDGKARAVVRAPASGNTAYSYFFYGITSIQVTFPEYVGRVNDCWRQGVTCTSDMVHQIIVDQSSVQATSLSPQNTNGDIAYGNHQFMATLTHPVSDTRCNAATGVADGAFDSNNCASWCHTSGQTVNGHNSLTNTGITADGTNDMCGNVLTIWGILNTYDELHMRQFGTIQEIWVQLQYAYSHKTGATTGFESPFPNVFFSAPQVVSVTGVCTGPTGDAYGKCAGYSRIQNVPYAGAVDDGDRWAEAVTGDRGDGFWVDDLDV